MEPSQRVASDDARLQGQTQQSVTGSRFQQMGGNSPHLDFQDSNLSPALSLLPSNSGLEHNTEYSLFQQSDMEFAPLRAYPDISMASERFHVLPHELTTQTLEPASLSQHPLAEDETVLSEGSNGSLSQHCLSSEHDKTKEIVSNTEKRLKDASQLIEHVDNITDETYFLNKDVPAQQLMQSLQKAIGVLSSSSGTNSSASNTSEKKDVISTDKPNIDPSLVREGPPGEASVSQQQLQTRLSDIYNVSVGSRSTKPDDSSEALRQEMLLDIQRRSSREAVQEPKSAKTPKEFATPFPTKIPVHKQSLAKGNLSSVSCTGIFSTGVQQRLRERDLWSPVNQTNVDGSYLGFLPQSQSTPGVFKSPPKSNVKPKFNQLSDIESTKEISIESHPESSPPLASASNPETKNQSQEKRTCEVQSLPSLTYMQKVDAWRANQSSGKASLFDTLALQGFTGVSPKKKAYDAVSDSLNRILTQQVVKMGQNGAQNAALSPLLPLSGASSPRREEAVGSAPSDKDNTGSAANQPASPFNRSQSHSSLSTVVMSVKKEQPTEARIEKDDIEEAEIQHTTTEGQLSPLVVSLGHFSDVTLSNSQDSSNSGQKVATSIGTSSVSLEVDNYDPYWTGKLSTPPPQHKQRELNIEERIPLYLQNLGIDQSPSTILTPFAPRGPIREPEFSPTELCTIKGSTPTKSIQPSEGGTPHKTEFSRSSLQSVDSSASIPLSSDGHVIAQELFRPASSSSDPSAAVQNDPKLQPYPSEDISSQQQQDGSQSPVLLAPSLDQDENKNLEAGQNAETSFVSSSAFSDIRKLLSQAEDIESPRISAGSDRFLSQRKESFFSTAFTTEESKSQSSHLWTRSSSDSVLTARERLTMGENVPKQSGVVSRSSGLSMVLNKSVPRAEPEGCSAAPPDSVPQQPRIKPPPPPSTPIVNENTAPLQTTVTPPPSTPSVAAPEEIKQTTEDSPVHSSTSSPVPADEMSDRGSDRSSSSSLAIRVAKLLQTETPATMVSSTNSVDQEEGKAREWIKQMISGQKCEPLELDQEDRRRIEEIKKELLLKNPKLGYASTDTESSAASSFRDPRLYSVEIPPKVIDTDKQQSSHLPNIFNTNVPKPQPTQGGDIEARVREIAAREGVSLPKTRALTSITISTCRRSTSPSPTASPAPPVSPSLEPLHLNQLTTEQDGNKHLSPTKEDMDLAFDSQVNQKAPLAARQDTVGAQYEDSASSSISLEQDNIKEGHSGLAKKLEKSTVTESLMEKTGKTGHISQVRLTLSPKPVEHSLDNSVFTHNFTLPQKHFVPLRHTSSTTSSPDEGVGLSSSPEWQEAPRRLEKSDTGKSLTQQRITSSIHVLPKTTAVEAMVPHLLPYKPRGSEELFYVPETEADISSTDTTMESTHTGSDDALPPSFSSEVLGHQDPGLDRGVYIRHTEGIYSKRLTKPHFTMTEPQHRGSPVALSDSSPINAPQTPKPASQVSSFTRVPLSITDVPTSTTSHRDQGTSPVTFLTQDPFSPNRDRLYTGHLETQNLLPSSSQANISSLDQLWQKFCERYSQEESRTIGDREASLLERLERLSRLIHSTRDSTISEIDAPQQEIYVQKTSRKTGGDLRELKERRHADKRREMAWKYKQDLDILTTKDAEESQVSGQADKDASDILSTTSRSMSTVDTARLVRAFGADRVQRNLRSSSSLSRLYTAINKQKEEERHKERAVTPSESSVTTNESSVVADSASSTNTYTLPSHRGPSKSLISKKAVKLVSKGIQAGDLEIVSNGTRRHTRDVGTTFPSPSDSRAPRQSSSSSSLDRAQKTPKSPSSKTQKQKKSQKSPSKRYPEGISWFISADELKSESRKENEPEEVSDFRPSSVWFEPFSKTQPWREPLRQRAVEDERNIHRSVSEPNKELKTKAPGLTRVSLQDALLAERPEFVSRCRQRMERLALQVEERRLQTLFSRERDELFTQPGGPGRLPRPAGTAQLRRAVPRKEMIQRSKQIYENLPEVRRRREEERRKAEYQSYRLNAQLYNKRITNRVLGRRTAWH